MNEYLTIREAVTLTGKSDKTIRRNIINVQGKIDKGSKRKIVTRQGTRYLILKSYLIEVYGEKEPLPKPREKTKKKKEKSRKIEAILQQELDRLLDEIKDLKEVQSKLLDTNKELTIQNGEWQKIFNNQIQTNAVVLEDKQDIVIEEIDYSEKKKKKKKKEKKKK